MKIAIVGAPDSAEKIYSALSSFYDGTDFIIRTAEKIEDTISFIHDIEENVDGFYLTGTGVYSFLNEKVNITKPVVFTKRGITGVIKSFWEFLKDENKISSLENLKLGLDVIEEKDFLEALLEFDINIDSYSLQKYDYHKKESEYLKFYLDSFEKKEINCVFTSFGYIYKSLKEKNYPVYRLQATNFEIREEFKNLQNIINMTRAENSKTSVEIIKIFRSEGISNNFLNDKIEFEKELLNYSKIVNGNIQTIGTDEYLILSNKGLLNDSENINTLLSIIKDCALKGFGVAVGIGEGNTIFLSEKNAKSALKVSISEKNNNIFFFDGIKIKGPLMEKREISYKNTSDEKIIEISKKSGVSALYIEKIKSIIKKQNKSSFTSLELSEFLNISERSTNRIIKKFIESGYAKSLKYENSLGAGRPRRMTEFYI